MLRLRSRDAGRQLAHALLRVLDQGGPRAEGSGCREMGGIMIASRDFGCCATCRHWTDERDVYTPELHFCEEMVDWTRGDDTCSEYHRREGGE